MTQGILPMNVVVAKVVDGIDMGVMDDGTPYLTNRGLSRVCGVSPSVAIERAQDWAQGKRTGKLAQMLVTAGYEGDLYVPIIVRGTTVYAFPDDVCMVFLEYYAFEASPPNTQARENYRKLARKSLRDFIYRSTGYDPNNLVPPRWRQFHDRMMLNVVPRGYFSVFREMSSMVVEAIQGGLTIDQHTIPDISVGQLWSKHWEAQKLEATYGPRIKYEHNYPEYFSQAASNPQPAWAYPLDALGAFRSWLQDIYLARSFPAYLGRKVKLGQLSVSTAELILNVVGPDEPPALPGASSP